MAPHPTEVLLYKEKMMVNNIESFNFIATALIQFGHSFLKYTVI